MADLLDIIPNVLDAAHATIAMVLDTLKRAGGLLRKKQWADNWTDEAELKELLKKVA